MQPMLNIAVRAARKAGNTIMRNLDNVHRLNVSEKARHDYVSEVDQQAENDIIEVLKQAYPKHAIHAEESGKQGESDYCWIIDPLDGTTNFLNGYPSFSVSIALQHRNQLVQAVVYDPLTGELFSASKGEGATLNNRRIRMNAKSKIDDSLIGTGFPFRIPERREEYLGMFENVMQECGDIRRSGSAALELAYVAAGRVGGFWELGLKSWDISAGALIIKEAGGFVSDLKGGDKYLQTGDVVCGAPLVHKRLLQLVK